MISLVRFIQRQGNQALRPTAEAEAEHKPQSESLPETAAAAAAARAAAATTSAAADTSNGTEDNTTTSAINASQDANPLHGTTGINPADDGTEVPANVEPTPMQREVPEALQRIRAAASRQEAQPPEPLLVRVQEGFCWLERFIMRHKTSSALLFAYCTFFWRLFGEVGKLGAELPKPAKVEFAAGGMFLDPAVDAPLTKASVLARAGTLAGMRREAKSKNKEAAEELKEEKDALALLEQSLRVAASHQEPQRRALLLAECYAALGRIHSSRGHYYEMLHAMSLALRFGADTGYSETVTNVQIMLGHLEFNHHRYFAAGTRFEDALQTGSSNASRAEALAGFGLSLLTQGHIDAAAVRFVEALGWTPFSTPFNLSTSAAAVARTAAGGNCSAHNDGGDTTRVLSLAGLGLAHAHHISGQQFSDRGTASVLLNCAVFLFHSIPADQQEAHIWRTLGHARHVLAEENAAKRYQQRAALKEFRDPDLAAANPKIFTCATAADLPSCSHNALHLGLTDFSLGNNSLGMGHVELLLSRTSTVPVEAAEWLIRFARSHSWTPAGRNFTAFLLGRAEPLLKSEGDARLARHFVDYGRFLLSHRDSPAPLKRALRQLRRASAIIERTDIGWADAEFASLYSTIGNVQHQLGDMEEALRNFEKALHHNKRSVANGGGEQDQKRLYLTYANLGAAKIQLAGTSPERWQKALADLRAARRVGLEGGLSILDPKMQELEASLRNAMRVAHHKGMLATCPGPLAALLYGASCPSDPLA